MTLDERFPICRMHEAAGLISIEGSFEGLRKDAEEKREKSAPDKRPAVALEDAAAPKSAKIKVKKAAKAKKASKV